MKQKTNKRFLREYYEDYTQKELFEQTIETIYNIIGLLQQGKPFTESQLELAKLNFALWNESDTVDEVLDNVLESLAVVKKKDYKIFKSWESIGKIYFDSHDMDEDDLANYADLADLGQTITENDFRYSELPDGRIVVWGYDGVFGI